MKIHRTISLDEAYIVEAKKRGLVLSTVLNDCLGDLLGGKKSKTKEEERLKLIIDIAGQMKLDKDMVLKIADTLDRGTVGLWQHFKHQFQPDFDMWRFIEIRREIKDLLNEFGGKQC